MAPAGNSREVPLVQYRGRHAAAPVTMVDVQPYWPPMAASVNGGIVEAVVQHADDGKPSPPLLPYPTEDMNRATCFGKLLG